MSLQSLHTWLRCDPGLISQASPATACCSAVQDVWRSGASAHLRSLKPVGLAVGAVAWFDLICPVLHANGPHSSSTSWLKDGMTDLMHAYRLLRCPVSVCISDSNWQ